MFSDLTKSFKLCVIITLLGVQQFTTGFMTLALFQGYRYVRIINCKLFLDSCPLWYKWCMVATHIKKIKDSMLCVTDVYLRDTTNLFSPVLHLNVSHLSILSSS